MGAKYIEKLVQLVGLQDKKARATPELAVADGSTKELVGARRSNYATAVGILLYISPDRPDAQHCIRELASHLVRPAESQYRQLEHLTCYLKGTAECAVRTKCAETQCGRRSAARGTSGRDLHRLRLGWKQNDTQKCFGGTLLLEWYVDPKGGRTIFL